MRHVELTVQYNHFYDSMLSHLRHVYSVGTY